MRGLEKTAKTVGALFLVAMAASLSGAMMIESILSSSDIFTSALENKSQLLLGVLLELINGISVVGIAVLMFPILKKYNESAARSYLCFRLTEAIFCFAALITPIALIKINAGALDAQDLQSAGSLLIAARAGIMDVIATGFFILGAALFYSMLYQSRILPRFISIWGIAAVILIFAVNILGLIQTTDMKLTMKMSLALPIILNEIFLGIWLIVKGFNNKIILENR
jgi:hypothetical protein